MSRDLKLFGSKGTTMKQWSTQSSRRGNSAEGSKLTLRSAVGEWRPNVFDRKWALPRARASSSSVETKILSPFPRFPPIEFARLGSSTFRNHFFFLDLRSRLRPVGAFVTWIMVGNVKNVTLRSWVCFSEPLGLRNVCEWIPKVSWRP